MQTGGDDGAVQAVVAAVDLSDLLLDLERVAGIRNVDGAGLDTGDLVGFLGLDGVQVSDLGSAQVVQGVGVHVDGAVLIALENVSAAAQRSGGDRADMAQVALGEAEHVVVVVVQAVLAVVVQGSDGDLELVDHGVGQLGGGDGHAVIAGLDDTTDVGSGLTGGDALGAHVVDILGDQVGQSGTGGLSLHLAEVPAVVVADGHEEVLGGRVGSQAVVSPVGSSGGNVVGVGSQTVGNAVVNDLLSELDATVVDSIPESGLLFFSPVGEVGVVLAGSSDQRGLGGHTAAVLLHTLDGQAVPGGSAVVGGIQVDVDAEDHVVDGDRLTVGELQIVTHGDVVSNGAVSVLGDNAVGGTVVGVIGAVVRTGLTLDAVEDHLTHTVGAEQNELVQAHDVVVLSGSGEEGREFALQAGHGNHQGVVGVACGLCGGGFAGRAGAAGRIRRSLVASGHDTKAHRSCRQQCKHLFGLFHVFVIPPFLSAGQWRIIPAEAPQDWKRACPFPLPTMFDVPSSRTVVSDRFFNYISRHPICQYKRGIFAAYSQFF